MAPYLAYIISKYPLNLLILGFVLGLIAYTRSPKGPVALVIPMAPIGIFSHPPLT